MWWPTPVMRRIWPGHTAMDEALAALILERERSAPGNTKSNQGGWHSTDDLLTWGGESVAGLLRWIFQAFSDMTALTSGGGKHDGQIEVNAWANVNRYGNYNIVHTHPASVWSGVYYVRVGAPAPEDKPRSGVLELIDPRAGAEMVAAPGAPFGLSKIIHPRPGEMILFPSWLKHMVHPYWGEGERISIAFNIRVRPKA